MASESSDPVVVVGAGLAGAMMALILAKRGLRVELYEKRRAEERADEGDGQARSVRRETHV
jgi:2-polyprenyl-6-methoxyphenol hydroxylase-like FAD-dependent oxidoreductase